MDGKSIGNFLGLVLKNGGASFVLTLTLAWLFREYFGINPDTTVQLLEWMLWMAFYQSIYVLLRGEFFTTLQKWRDYRANKPITPESVADVSKDIGLKTVVTLIEKGTELRSKLADTKDEKKKDKLRVEIEVLEKELAEAELEAI